MLTRSLVAAALVASLVTACSDDGPGPAPGTRTPSLVPSSATPSGSATSGGASAGDATSAPARPAELPLGFDTVGATTLTEVNVQDIALTDDVAITMTPTAVTGRTLPDLSSTTYTLSTPGASYTDLDVVSADRALVVGTGVVPGSGTRLGQDAITVTEFDPSTGETGRQVTVQVDQDPLVGAAGPLGVHARVVAATDDRVVLDALSSAVAPGDALGDATTRHTTVVVDLADAEQPLAWTERPATPLVERGGQVVVKTGTARRGGQLRSLSLDDGSTQWTALDRTKAARLVGATDDELVVTRLSVGSDETTVVGLSLDDGSVLATRATFSWIWNCFETTRPVALCNVSGRPVLVAWDLSADAATWRLPDKRRFAPTLSAVVDDRAYGVLGQDGVVLSASTGKELASGTGAAPTQVSAWGGLSVVGGRAIFQPAVEDPITDK